MSGFSFLLQKMTYLEYKDGGQTNFVACVGILRALSKGNRNKSLIIGVFCWFSIEEYLKYKKYELLTEVHIINLEYQYGGISCKI